MATRKQKIAVDKVVENGGNITKAMRDANYSEATINNPNNLTESKGYKELMEVIDKKITPELIAKRHKELLDKRENSLVVSKVNKEGDKTYKVISQPETQAVTKGLDMLYKMKGAYKTGDVNVQVNIANLIGKYGN